MIERRGRAKACAWETSGRFAIVGVFNFVFVFGCDAEAGSDRRDFEEACGTLPRPGEIVDAVDATSITYSTDMLCY